MGNLVDRDVGIARRSRLDPLTGAIREYPLPASARPHSIVPDDEGAIWYLGNSNGTVGKLNPLTGEIRSTRLVWPTLTPVCSTPMATSISQRSIREPWPDSTPQREKSSQ